MPAVRVRAHTGARGARVCIQGVPRRINSFETIFGIRPRKLLARYVSLTCRLVEQRKDIERSL